MLKGDYWIEQRMQWHPIPVLLPGKSHGWRSLVGCSLWGSWRVGHDWATSLSLFTLMHWRRKWQPAGSKLCPWQRSWGRRLGIRKGGIKPQEPPWKFSSIYPQNQSLPTFCFVLSPTPLTLWGAIPHYLSLKKRVSLQLQWIIPGCDSVSTYKLLWKSSSLPE